MPFAVVIETDGLDTAVTGFRTRRQAASWAEKHVPSTIGWWLARWLEADQLPHDRRRARVGRPARS